MNEDKALVKRIHELETAIQDFKAPQPVGTDSVRTYTTQTNNEWDIVWTATSDGFAAWNRWKIRFKSAHQNAPFGRLRVIADFNGVKYDWSTISSAYLSTTRNFLSVHDDYLGTGLATSNDRASEFEDPQLLRFEVLGSAVAVGVVVRMKFFVEATDTGRIYFDNGQN